MIGAPWSFMQVLGLKKREGKGGAVRPASRTGEVREAERTQDLEG
jgi:hypothetical protein